MSGLRRQKGRRHDRKHDQHLQAQPRQRNCDFFPPVFILFECVYLTLLNQVKLKKCRKYSIKLLYIGCCKVFVFVNPNFDI